MADEEKIALAVLKTKIEEHTASSDIFRKDIKNTLILLNENFNKFEIRISDKFDRLPCHKHVNLMLAHQHFINGCKWGIGIVATMTVGLVVTCGKYIAGAFMLMWKHIK